MERVQYTDTEKISTTTLSKPLTPGNMTAAIAADPDYKKPGLEDQRVYDTGKLVRWQLPLPVMENTSTDTPSQE